MAQEIRRNCTIVCDLADGGTLDVWSPDGEIVHSFYVERGRHRASTWLDLLPPEHVLVVGKGVACFQPRMGVAVSQHPLALKSDANPEFVATSASRLEREMRVEMNEMRNLRLVLQKEARQRALDSVQVGEAIPTAPKADAAEGVEDEAAKS